MWLSRGGLVGWLLLPQAPAEAQEPALVWHSLTRLEAAAVALLPGATGGAAQGFASTAWSRGRCAWCTRGRIGRRSWCCCTR